ncbi:MAG: DUF4336 domain-containing protein [Byssovorax sp.]
MREIVPGQIHVREHSLRLAGGHLLTRMTLIGLADGGVLIHSPVPFDDDLRAQTARLGEVRAILAPSTCHHLFVADAQRAFPGVPTYAVPGLEKKRPDLALERLPDALWADEIDRVIVGNRVMREVVLLHRASRTVIAVDLIEHFRDETPGVDRVMRMWIKLMGMWNKPRPAPELRLFTRDRAAARHAIEQILAWDFDRMVIAHGEMFDRDAKEALREAWRFVLGSEARGPAL